MKIKRLIVYLIRKRFGLKLYERFQFENQNNKDVWYYFGDASLVKLVPNKKCGSYVVTLSGVSLNWLLNDECRLRKE